jgi:hypothetical protein
MEKSELIIYQASSSQILNVRLEDETVWLTQNQMAELFEATKQNISSHINNIFREKELEENSTVKESLTVQKEGRRVVRRKVFYYNLDVIISVGYRVKSHRGTQFRIWANQVLKEYLLKGYVLHQRIEKLEQKVEHHDRQFDLIINTNLPPKEGIFYDGQIFDAYEFVAGLIKSAGKEIILLDNYIDEVTLSLLAKKKKEVKLKVYTQKISETLKTDCEKFESQYGAIEMNAFNKSHDRFLILDHKTVYHIGASLKDLGKKWFAFSKLEMEAQLILNELK